MSIEDLLVIQIYSSFIGCLGFIVEVIFCSTSVADHPPVLRLLAVSPASRNSSAVGIVARHNYNPSTLPVTTVIDAMGSNTF